MPEKSGPILCVFNEKHTEVGNPVIDDEIETFVPETRSDSYEISVTKRVEGSGHDRRALLQKRSFSEISSGPIDSIDEALNEETIECT